MKYFSVKSIDLIVFFFIIRSGDPEWNNYILHSILFSVIAVISAENLQSGCALLPCYSFCSVGINHLTSWLLILSDPNIIRNNCIRYPLLEGQKPVQFPINMYFPYTQILLAPTKNEEADGINSPEDKRKIIQLQLMNLFHAHR